MRLWFKKGAWASDRARRRVAAMSPADVGSVAVIRHAALGDMVLTRPFLIEARRFFPNAKITLSIRSHYTRGAPADLVDRVHVTHGSDQRKAPAREQIARIRELGYHDVLFDLAADARSTWLCLLNPAVLKIGFPYRAIYRRVYDITVTRTDMRFEAENMLDMLSVLGHACEYPLTYGMPREASQRERSYMVYFPGASTPDKCWPHDRFAELIDGMAADYPGHEHVVLQGIGAWERIDDIVGPLAHRPNVTPLALDDFERTVTLVSGARLLVSNDTGIRNVAIACGTPTVGIFFLTEPFRYWPRDGRHEAAFVLDGSMPAAGQVGAQARRLLERTAR
jgi:ADP-heptose:LPS heptosyltransferase